MPMTSSTTPLTQSGRVLIVANRLPVTMAIKSKEDGLTDIEFHSSSGGVASALAGISNVWIGWPGDEVISADDRRVVTDKLHALECIPVFLTNELSSLFYNGFCNDLLWPLLHYMSLPMEGIKSHERRFRAYRDANAHFAQVVLDHYCDGDVVWVHDYHLMLVPYLLRRAKPDMQIGFFFHTPFPCSEVYSALPSRTELLQGVLNSNLIGFHTDEYLKHFQSSTVRLLNTQWNNGQAWTNGVVSRLGTYPIGIDAQKFTDTVASSTCQKYIHEFKSQFAGRKVLLGIDRLDYIKGILQKLLALESFFEQHPEWIGRVILVQLAVPSRTDVLEYQMFKAETHKLVSRINGRFGSVANVPICYLDQSMPFEKMCALYRCADVMMVTSIRDGMNLVSYEYVACQKDSDGVLVLSEFCGAVRLLAAGALQINPWNIKDVADTIHKALTMSQHDRRKLSSAAFNHVIRHTAKDWANEFLDIFRRQEPSSPVAQDEDNEVNELISRPSDMDAILSKLTHDQRKLLISNLMELVQRVDSLSPSVAHRTNGDDTCISYSRYQDVGELWGWQQSVATPDTSNAFASLGSTECFQNNITSTIVTSSTAAPEKPLSEVEETSASREMDSTMSKLLRRLMR